MVAYGAQIGNLITFQPKYSMSIAFQSSYHQKNIFLCLLSNYLFSAKICSLGKATYLSIYTNTALHLCLSVLWYQSLANFLFLIGRHNEMMSCSFKIFIWMQKIFMHI